MKVWVVMGDTGWGENAAVSGIFSTPELAFAYYEANRAPDDLSDGEARRRGWTWFVGEPEEHVVDAKVSNTDSKSGGNG